RDGRQRSVVAMKPSTFFRRAGAIAAAALILRVGYVLALGTHPKLGIDGTWYALQAGTIADGLGYLDVGRYFALRGAVPTAQFPPLWPAVLSLFHVAGVDSLFGYRFVGAFVGTTTVFTTACIGRRLVGARTGLVAATIMAVSPWMTAADGSLMAESLFVAFVTIAVLIAVQLHEHPSRWRFALLGLVLGLATMTRTDGVIIGAVLVAATAWRTPGLPRRRLALGALAGGVLLMVLVPWTIRNQNSFGTFVPVSNNSGSLIGGSNCASTYSSDIGGWDFACIRAIEASGRSEVVRTDRERSAGLAYARHHLARFAMTVPVRVLRGWGLWSPVVLADAEAGESRNRTMQLVGWPIELGILGLGAIGAVVAIRARVPVALLFTVIGAATLVLVMSWGNQRFRIVAAPEVGVFAAIALDSMWTRTRPGDAVVLEG
ncbi:MAG: glycosyltransferase family 39 protein, partial [Acidimicrobiia bacterium]